MRALLLLLLAGCYFYEKPEVCRSGAAGGVTVQLLEVEDGGGDG